jgi:hypothetical protein
MGVEGQDRGVFPPHPVPSRQVVTAVRQVVRWNDSLLYGTTAFVFLVVHAVVLGVVSLLWPVSLVALVALMVSLTAVGHVVLMGVASVVVGRAVLGSGISYREVRAWLRPSWWRLVGLSALGVPAVAAGLALGVVPGVLLWMVLSLAVPVLVLEKTTVGQAFTRALAMLRGRWGWMSFRLVVLPGLAWVLLVLMNYLSVPPYRHYHVLLSQDAPPIPMLLLITVCAFGWSTFISPRTAVVAGLAYADRRIAVPTTRQSAAESTTAP